MDGDLGEGLAGFCQNAGFVVIPVACELRSPARAFGRMELVSLFRFVTRPSKGRSSTSLPLSCEAAA